MLETREIRANPTKQDHIASGGVIGSHVLQHMYGNGFFVLLTAMYDTLGLNPVSAGLVGTIRALGSGTASTLGGVLIDRFQHRRLAILYLSMTTMGFGYLLIGLAPTYVLILVALAFTAGAGSIWHPAARSLLSQIYPTRRGFIISLDRSAGSVGDTIGPLAAGALLAYITWQQIYMLALPMAFVVVIFLWTVLRRAPTYQQLGARKIESEQRPIKEQLSALREVLRNSGNVLTILLVVKAVAGFGQGGLLLWVPLYLSQDQGMSTFAVGVHVALLTGVGIATGPAFGWLSDHRGRVPVILLVLGGKAVIAGLLAIFGTGIMLTILIAALGGFMFGVNSLIQAWALDLAAGRRLEGTMMGTMYGVNMIFQGLAPLIVGVVVAAFGFSSLFIYVASMNAIGLLLMLSLLPILMRHNRANTGHREL
jgi:FSR family fosmidomycin resistance protein-like MFS transporter